MTVARFSGPSDPEERAISRPGLPHYSRAAAAGLTFRPATAEDMGFLFRLYASTRADELAPLPWSSEQKSAFLAMQFEAQHSHYLKHYPDALWLVIERDGAPLGRLYLEHWTSQHRIIDIALMPEARGQGLGSALLRDILDEAGRRARAVSIHVEKENPAMRLYKRLGFETVEDKGVYDLLQWHPPAVAAP